MKFNFKSLSLLCIAMTLCVAGLGIGYGGWTETINISGTVIVENMVVEWYEQHTNDPYNGQNNATLARPPYERSLHPDITMDPRVDWFTAEKEYETKDVGWTWCQMLDSDDPDTYLDTIVFEVHNAYPGYLGEFWALVKNRGGLPVQVDSVNVTYMKKVGEVWVEDMSYSNNVSDTSSFNHPPEFEVRWTNGAHALPIKIGSDSPGNTTTLGCDVHVLEAATQGATYRFRVTFNFSGPVVMP